jgi:hypothetical protein
MISKSSLNMGHMGLKTRSHSLYMKKETLLTLQMQLFLKGCFQYF